MIELTCQICGKKFLAKNYLKDKRKFCSRQCMGKACYDKNLRYIDHSYSKGNQYRKGIKSINSFQKGHQSWNKGLKGIHLSKETEFKKGCISPRRVEIGTIKQRTNKGKIRNYIKVDNPNKWQLYYVYLWEQKYGKVPKGYVIHHINKIPNDDRIENLICLTRAEHINIHREDFEY